MKIGYARISTSDQNLNLQEDALKNAGCDKVFTDRLSGSTKERPGLIQVLEFLRPGDTLVIWRLDRLARSLKDLISLVASLKDREIHLISLNESIDTNSLNGRLIFHIFAALAEFESGLIKERTKAGLTAARARGRNGGRPKLISSSQESKLKLLIKDPNFSPKELQEMFGVSKATLYRYANLNNHEVNNDSI
jgi:DNA invertase Pin-like site-specific DNA recombinase